MRKEIHLKAHVLDLLSRMKSRILAEQNHNELLKVLEEMNALLEIVESWSISATIKVDQLDLILEELDRILKATEMNSHGQIAKDWKPLIFELEDLFQRTYLSEADELNSNASPVCFAKEREVRASFLKP